MSRDDLINRCPSGAHPRTAIGTAGQPCGRAGPVAIAAWRPDIMPNEDVLLVRLKFLHPLVQTAQAAVTLNLGRLPATLGHAVRKIKIAGSQLGALGRHGQYGERLHCLQPGERHRGSNGTEHGSTRELPGFSHCQLRFCSFRNLHSPGFCGSEMGNSRTLHAAVSAFGGHPS